MSHSLGATTKNVIAATFTDLSAGVLVHSGSQSWTEVSGTVGKLLFLLLCIMLLKILNVPQFFRSQFLVTTHFQDSRYELTGNSSKSNINI